MGAGALSERRDNGSVVRIGLAQSDQPGAAPSRTARQAVVIVHGMGEQRPMDTVRDFARAVLRSQTGARNGDTQEPEFWSRPDGRTGSLELRRLTTRKSQSSEAFPNGARTDFYELYWADLTGGSTWTQFGGWIRYLLFRPWSQVPRDVRSAWVALWIVTGLACAVGLASILPDDVFPTWVRVVLAVSAASLGALVHKMATASFGRVVRYTRADPANISARAAVRERGLRLLNELHAGGEYDRIVLVGHSLGSILAYDLINYLWTQREDARTLRGGGDELAALRSVHDAAAALRGGDAGSIERFRRCQARLRRLLAARQDRHDGTDRWLISDFVTIGSPLTHAEFLLATNAADLGERIDTREYPAAPPVREPLNRLGVWLAKKHGFLGRDAKEGELFVFPKQGGGWCLHHASPFAVVRWTNIHDPARWIYRGDLVSGALSGKFGLGVKDVDLSLLRGKSRSFSHTSYWALDAPSKQLDALRDAINLLDND